MSARPHPASTALTTLTESLSVRDIAVVKQVAELRMMSARQIRDLHFPPHAHESEMAAVRSCHRVLQRLTTARLLVRLDRRIGGVRSGSSGFIYSAGPAAHRLLADGRPRRRAYEPTARFVDHTLAVAQLVTDVTLAARSGMLDRVEYQAEPDCWRSFSRAGARVVLRPDLALTLTAQGFEYRWFIEIDRASESLPVILRKSRLAASLYQSGIEQARNNGTFPRVCWITPDEHRAKKIRDAIARDRQLPARLFVVARSGTALSVLAGGEP